MDADVKDRVVMWCRQEGLLRDQLDDPRARWHIRASAPAAIARSVNGCPLDVVDVSQSIEDAERIVVYAGLDLDPALVDALRSGGIGELVRDLEMTLASRPEAFLLDYADGALRSVVVLEEIYPDGLTKDRLMRALRGVHKSVVLALWTLRPSLERAGYKLEIDEGRPAPGGRGVAPLAAETPVPAPDLTTCASCGAALRRAARFCTVCGTPVSGEGAS
jgi:hypothetical protein